MGAHDISLLSLGLSFLLLAVPLSLFIVLKVRLTRRALWSAGRMAVQLALVGVFLEYLFKLDNSLVNIGWLLVMVSFAAISVIGSTGISYRAFMLPVLVSLLVTTMLILLYFNGLVIRLGNLLEARYLIAIAGMLLGNALGGNIFGIGDFFRSVSRDQNRYHYSLSLGATRYEALSPYLRRSMVAALKPALASMATMGLVFLPGMMTGQVLSGEDPLLAIKYQMAIVTAIFACVSLSVVFTVLLTVPLSFDEYGVLKDVFRKGKAPVGPG